MADKVRNLDPDCTTCKFSEAHYAPPPSIEKVLICRRFPPTPVMVQGPQGIGQTSVFPLVSAEAWCHEWTERDGPVMIVEPANN